mmetsp:Transcript_26739/g.68011  ORF Transcript_26739/g.68011 Transcript_26739/m.68011 type:complete len:990 (+) Transcript_26739:190-3159(+)
MAVGCWQAQAWFGGVAVMLYFADFGWSGTLLPLFLEHIGVEPNWSGYIFTTQYASATLGLFASGVVADRFGIQPTLTVVMLALVVVLNVQGQVQSLEALIACRALLGFFGTYGLGLSWISHVSSSKRLVFDLSLAVFLAQGGVSLGGAVAGQLSGSQFWIANLIQSVFAFCDAFAICLSRSWVAPNPAPVPRRLSRSAAVCGLIYVLRRSRIFNAASFASFVFGGSLQMHTTLAPLLIRDRHGLASSYTGWMFAIAGLITLVCHASITPYVSKNFPVKGVIGICLINSCAFVVMAVWAGSAAGVLLSFTVISYTLTAVALGICNVLISQAARKCVPEDMGATIGFTRCLFTAGQAVTPALATSLNNAVGAWLPYTIWAVLIALATVFLVAASRSEDAIPTAHVTSTDTEGRGQCASEGEKSSPQLSSPSNTASVEFAHAFVERVSNAESLQALHAFLSEGMGTLHASEGTQTTADDVLGKLRLRSSVRQYISDRLAEETWEHSWSKKSATVRAISGAGGAVAVMPQHPSSADIIAMPGRKSMRRSFNGHLVAKYCAAPSSQVEVVNVMKWFSSLSKSPKKVIVIAHFASFTFPQLELHHDAGNLPTDLVVDISAMRRVLSVDEASLRVTVEAGISWEDLVAHLKPYDLAIENMSAYTKVTVGGAVATGTHGSGTRHLSDQITSMSVVDAKGEVHTITDSALFTHLGVLGVVCEITLRVVPLFFVKQGCYTFSEWCAGPEQMLADHFTLAQDVFPSFFSMMLRVSLKEEGHPVVCYLRSVASSSDDDKHAETFFGAPLNRQDLVRSYGGLHSTEKSTYTGCYDEVLPDHSTIAQTSDAPIPYFQAEYFIPLAQAATAVNAFLYESAKDDYFTEVLPSGLKLRFVETDEQHLSPSANLETTPFVIAFQLSLYGSREEVGTVLRRIEEALWASSVVFATHWGKLAEAGHAKVNEHFKQRAKQFNEKRQVLDPENAFLMERSELGKLLLDDFV